MDAVKAAVDEMSGSLRVRSTPRAGTTITITLPLTMAIISAVLVEVDDATFAIPLSAVREILKIRLADLKSVSGRRVVLLREEVLALVHLGNALKDDLDSKEEAATEGMPVVVVDFEGRKIGLEVGKIIGTREVVIKSLSRHYREIDGLIGASILGNGKIALIVDVETLVSQHYHAEGANGKIFHKGIVDIETREEEARPSAPLPLDRPGTVPRPPAAPAAGAPSNELTPVDVAAFEGSHEPSPPPSAPRNEQLTDMDELTRKVINSQGTPLEVVNNTSAIQASMSLSQFTGREIRVSFPESRLVPISDVAETMGGEEASVGGIYVEVQGDLHGGNPAGPSSGQPPGDGGPGARTAGGHHHGAGRRRPLRHVRDGEHPGGKLHQYDGGQHEPHGGPRGPRDQRGHVSSRDRLRACAFQPARETRS